MENRIVVGVADMKVANNPRVYVVTYSLGSCIGVSIYDPVVKVGGMLHYMLPDASSNPEQGREKPFMYADTGIPALLEASYKLGAKKSRLILHIAGGASIMDYNDVFKIGKRNIIAARKIFFENNMKISNEDIGGRVSRTLFLDIKSGEVTLRSNGRVISRM